MAPVCLPPTVWYAMTVTVGNMNMGNFFIYIYITIILSLVKCHSRKHKLWIIQCFTLSKEHVSMKIAATFETNTCIESFI